MSLMNIQMTFERGYSGIRVSCSNHLCKATYPLVVRETGVK